jgi:hypothetical protein
MRSFTMSRLSMRKIVSSQKYRATNAALPI